jgi:hypothetical protein
MIYVTELDVCPHGCGSVMFLKSIESGKIFVYCSLCGLAWDKPPTPNVVAICDIPETFAPAGIAFPRREEIEAAGFGGYIAGERQDEHYIRVLWHLRAKTFFAAGDYAKVSQYSPKSLKLGIVHHQRHITSEPPLTAALGTCNEPRMMKEPPSR